LLTVRYEILETRPGVRLLDLGCGAGRHTFAAQERGAKVVSADLDDAALKDVRAMGVAVASESAVEPPECVVADALALPFADASFDQVIASEVLEHIPDDVGALREIERVLKPEGRLAVTVPRFWPERVCWALSDDYHSNAGGHVRIYRRQEMLAKLRSAGFTFQRSHHAHALHVPYWWLKCLFGMDEAEHLLPRLYHRFLVWDIEKGKPWVSALERALNPFMGKSVVFYARKVGRDAV
jgi:SAM-dependent methyltransferase